MLPNVGTLLLIAALILTQHIWARPFQAPVNAPGASATTVNYQGRLADNAGAPLDGTYGMTFALYDEVTGGNLIWGPEEHTAVPVSEGLFSVGLGSKTQDGIPTTTWNGDRYLEITVGGETLTPRELIRSVPIAGMALMGPDGAITDDKLAEPVSRITLLDRKTPLCDSLDSAYPIDGEWHDVDISGKIPDTAKAVMIQVVVNTPTKKGTLHVAPGGEHQRDYLSVSTYYGWHFNQGIVKVINGRISYNASPDLDRFFITMHGYIE
jgi:hypothetical protein